MIPSTHAQGTEALGLGAECARERKFVATPRCAARFLERLSNRTTHESPDPASPVTYNRTTYLDTPDHLYLRSSLTGPARKLRIREYASASAEGIAPALFPFCFLELKESSDGVRSKTRLATDPASLVRLLAGEDIGDSAGVEGDAYRTLRDLIRRESPEPRVTSWYRRTTRISEDRSVRITVDSGLCFTEPVVPGSEPAAAFPLTAFARVPFCIVEVKSLGELPEWLTDELDELTEVRGFSKFEQGMAHLTGGMP